MSERQEFTEDMNGFSEDDRHLERLLASLVPRESRLSRDRVMFLAGQASAVVSQRSQSLRLNRWIWPAASACSACLGLFVGLSLGHVPATPVQSLAKARATLKTATAVEPGPEQEAEAMPAASDEQQASSLLALQNRMLAAEADDFSRSAGAFGLAESAVHPLRPVTYPELLRQLLAEKS